MKAAALALGLLLAVGAGAQDVRHDTAFEVIDFLELRQELRDTDLGGAWYGDRGSVVIAGFDGVRMTFRIMRRKRANLREDLVQAQALAATLAKPEIDFNVQETPFKSEVELDFADLVKRDGLSFSASLPLGRIAGELKKWKNLPRPIYVVTGAKNGAVANGRSGVVVELIEEVEPEREVQFHFNSGALGVGGIALWFLVAAALVTLPFITIRNSLRMPIDTNLPTNLEVLKARKREELKHLRGVMIVPGAYLLYALTRFLPVDPFWIGSYLLTGRGPSLVPLLVIAAPLYLIGVGAPHIITAYRRRKAPRREESLRDRTRRRQNAVGLNSFLWMMGVIAIMGSLLLAKDLWLPAVSGASIGVFTTIVGVLFLAAMFSAVFFAFRSRASMNELLPPGHRLVEPVHDAGRDAGVHVQDVAVAPGAAYRITGFRGNFILMEPVIALMPDGEARALIDFEVARFKALKLAFIPAGAFVLTLFVTFAFGRTVFLGPDIPKAIIALIGGFAVALGACCLAYRMIQPRQWEAEKEALEFAVKRSGRPDDLMMALARQATLDGIRPLTRRGKGSPIHIKDRIAIIREFASQNDVRVMAGDPLDVVAREVERGPTEIEDRFRGFYRLFNVKDIEPLLEQMTEDVDWPAVHENTRVTGRTAVCEYWRRQFDEVDPRVSPVEITEQSDGKVEVLVDQVVRDLRGNVMVAGTVRHVFTLRDGLIARMDVEPFKPPAAT